MAENRRRLKYFLIEPRAQLKLYYLFLGLSGLSFIIIELIYWDIAHLIKKFMVEMDISDAKYIPLFTEMSNHLMVISVTGIVVVAIASFVCSVISTHKIFGPMVHINSHIDKLCDMNFDDKIVLRTGDEFREVAENLNRLTSILKNKTKSPQV
jgi:signal transduction histidine kinase